MQTAGGQQTPKIFFVATEKSIAEQCGIEIKFPIRLFTLRGLGVDEERFIRELGLTFGELPWDGYDPKREQVGILAKQFPEAEGRLRQFLVDYYADRRGLSEVSDLVERLPASHHRTFDSIRPYRRRSVARFILRYHPLKSWQIERVLADAFSQTVGGDDARSLKRVFAEMSGVVTDYPEFQKLMRVLGEIVRSIHPDARQLVVVAHQVRTVARPEKRGDNAPEGIHQDGTDYIVSAIEIAQVGSTGGESFVLGPDKETEYLRVNLGVGQGIFQADGGSPLWHDVTPIEVLPGLQEGFRDTFGFDITLER